MADWKNCKWGDLATLEYGKGLSNYLRTDGKYPVYGTNGKIGTTDKFLCSTPSLVIGRKGAYRGVHYSREPFFVIDTAFYLKPKAADFDMTFAYYQLLTVDINNMDSGSAIPSTSREDFYDINISLPSLPEQKAIAEVLSSLDDKIDLLHRQNKTLEAMAETLFRQWFVEEAEESWEKFRVGDLGIYITDFVANGSFASLKQNVTLIPEIEDYALFIRNTDLKSGFSQKVFVDKHSYEFLSKSKLFGGEVIISNVADVGSVHLCPKFDRPMTLGNNVIMLKSNFNLFIYLFFKSELGQSLIYGITSGSAQQKFNKTDFKNIEINIPSIKYLSEFQNVAEIYFEKIEQNQNQIRSLTNLRDTLLPKLMSGEEVRVRI